MDSLLTCPVHKDNEMSADWIFCPHCATPLVPQTVNSGPGLFEEFPLGPISIDEIRETARMVTRLITSDEE